MPLPVSSAPLAAAAAAARAGDASHFDALAPSALAALADGVDDDGRSLLHSAALGCDPALLARLLSACPSSHVSLGDDEGWTPLHCAASAGRGAAVDALLAAGAPVDARTRGGGRTPLHYAASKGHADVVTALLAAGADPTLRDALGATPLHRAAGGNAPAVVRALLADGRVKVGARDGTGNTPLHAAAAAGAGAPAALLVAAVGDGARDALETTNREGSSPLELAGEALARRLVGVAQGEVDVEEVAG